MRDIALDNEILRGVVGLTSHGTAIEGQDDRDEMGVFIEPPEHVCGLTPCEHYVYRDQPEGVRSQPGDLDLVMYSLRKFCRLATQGNPSVILLLWLPEHISKTQVGRLTLPVGEPNLTTLRAVRTGQVNFSQALRLIDDAEVRLAALVEACPWQVDIDGINRFMVRAHAEHWRAHGHGGQSEVASRLVAAVPSSP
jgi:hypothetical protein